MDEIRVRFAPSPTGPLHIGSVRTALFNYLYAKKYGGKFILRIEDTDKSRSKEEYELDIESGLSWLGLGWDEGPETPDLFGPYRQSERLHIYKKYIDELLVEKLAYHCYCTVAELDEERKTQEMAQAAPKYSGRCKNLTPDEIKKFQEEGRKPSVRFIVPENERIEFKDLIHGKVSFDPKLFGDFIIVKSDGAPVFMFAGVIDDALMKISHVIRGDDHLSNTPKQILLAKALNLAIPEYGHLPMILNPDRTKLSKRKNPTSITGDFQSQGYLPEAMINFLVLMGWSPHSKATRDKSPKVEKEFFNLLELTTEFDLEEVGTSPSIFDQKKLDYLNGYYIRKMPLGDLAKNCLPYFEKTGFAKGNGEMILKSLALVQERMKKLSESPELVSFIFEKPQYEGDLLIAKKADKITTLKGLKSSMEVLEKETDFSQDSTEQLLRALANKINIEVGTILWSIRVALSGRPASPGVFELLEIFGKDESLSRIKTAVDMLE